MTTILFRRGTSVQAATNNPVLDLGEPGWEQDTRVLKIGDGITPWSELPALNGGGGGGGAVDSVNGEVGVVTLNAADVGAAPASHNHDGTYSPVNHNHSGVYSPVGHNHDSAYASTTHNHDAAYIKSTGIRDAVVITQAAYDALATKVATTLYVIQG